MAEAVKTGSITRKLRELLGKRGKWVLSYNDHPKAYELYDGISHSTDTARQ